jgi:hypothetical protein
VRKYENLYITTENLNFVKTPKDNVNHVIINHAVHPARVQIQLSVLIPTGESLREAMVTKDH